VRELGELLAHQDPIAHVAVIKKPADGDHRPVQRLQVVPRIEAHAMLQQGPEHGPGRVGIRRSAVARGIIRDERTQGDGTTGDDAAGAGEGLLPFVRWRDKKRFTST